MQHLALTPAPSAMMKALRVLIAVHRFTRFGAAGFTLLLPLLGAVAAGGDVSFSNAWKLLPPAAAFHLFAYVLNDVCDLPIDRTSPSRARFPLVQEKIRPQTALLFALAQMPLAFLAATGLGSGTSPRLLLLAAFILMAAYNVWGKVCPLPPLTDALQGLSWAALAAWGGQTQQAQPTLLLFLLCGSIVTFILLINGVHGALHDLENDLRHRARTTALFLGASIKGNYIFPGHWLPRYAVSLQMIVMLLAAAAIYRAPGQESSHGRLINIVALMALGCVCLRQSTILFARAFRSSMIERVGMWHLVCSHALLILPYTLLMTSSVLILSAAAFTVPLLAMWIRQRVDQQESRLQQDSLAAGARATFQVGPKQLL